SSLGCPARTESRPIPHLAKRSEPMRHLGDSLVIRDAACKPRLRRLAKYRTPDGEAFHQPMPRGNGKALLQLVRRRVEAEHDDAARVFVMPFDGRAGVGPFG